MVELERTTDEGEEKLWYEFSLDPVVFRHQRRLFAGIVQLLDVIADQAADNYGMADVLLTEDNQGD